MAKASFDAITDEELERYSLDLLDRELGPEVFEGFLSITYAGSSDYIRDRHKWLGHLTIDDITQKLSPELAESEAAQAPSMSADFLAIIGSSRIVRNGSRVWRRVAHPDQ